MRLARLAGYTNAGTVEFLYQPAEQRFAFLEVNTRLQVEHPVTELTTGLDLVKLQLLVAGGEALSGEAPSTARRAATPSRPGSTPRTPQRGFAPAPGTIETLVLPAGPGIRVDTGVAEGDVIPPEFDSMIAKVIASGRDRDEALGRLHRALGQTVVVVRGGTTNKSFLLDLLDRPEVRDGNGRHRLARPADRRRRAPHQTATPTSPWSRPRSTRRPRASVFGRRRFLAWASRGRPIVDGDVGHVIELRHGATSYRVTVREIGPSRFAGRLRRLASDRALRVARSGAQSAGDRGADRRGLAFDPVVDPGHRPPRRGRRCRPPLLPRRRRHGAGTRHRAGGRRRRARPGRWSTVGDRLLVVEAMKMEIAITAPLAGRVVDVLVARNVQVDAGAPLRADRAAR